MEVPELGVQMELQLPAYTTGTAIPDPQLNEAKGIKPTSSWILVTFLTPEAQWELQEFL